MKPKIYTTEELCLGGISAEAAAEAHLRRMEWLALCNSVKLVELVGEGYPDADKECLRRLVNGSSETH